jgi:hypothetical protein
MFLFSGWREPHAVLTTATPALETPSALVGLPGPTGCVLRPLEDSFDDVPGEPGKPGPGLDWKGGWVTVGFRR